MMNGIKQGVVITTLVNPAAVKASQSPASPEITTSEDQPHGRTTT